MKHLFQERITVVYYVLYHHFTTVEKQAINTPAKRIILRMYSDMFDKYLEITNS